MKVSSLSIRSSSRIMLEVTANFEVFVFASLSQSLSYYLSDTANFEVFASF